VFTGKVKVDSVDKQEFDMGEGSYTIKTVKGRQYLCRVYYDKQGKQVWETSGNVKDIKPSDPNYLNLIKAQGVRFAKEARDIYEQYRSGKIDKTKAKSELNKLLER